MNRTYIDETSDLLKKAGTAVEPSGQNKERKTPRRDTGAELGVIGSNWGAAAKAGQIECALAERR